MICVIQRNSSENSSALGHDMSDQEYVLLDEIGEGAFGKVYKSRKESTQEILAAKVKVLQRVRKNDHFSDCKMDGTGRHRPRKCINVCAFKGTISR